MTANVNIEIARREQRPAGAEHRAAIQANRRDFAALGQTPPAAGGRGRGAGAGSGAGPDTRATPPANSGPPARSRWRSNRRPCARTEAARPPKAAGTVSANLRSATSMASEGGRGQGAGGGRRTGRGNFAERLAGMTPEERERFMERMRARGITPPPDEQAAAAPQSGRGQGARAQNQAQPARQAAPPVRAQNGADDVRRAVRSADADRKLRPGLAPSERQAAARPAQARDQRRSADRTHPGARRQRRRRHRGCHERDDGFGKTDDPCRGQRLPRPWWRTPGFGGGGFPGGGGGGRGGGRGQ